MSAILWCLSNSSCIKKACRPLMSDLPKLLTATEEEEEVVVRVRSREGDEVTWTQQASCLAGTLRNWMSTTDDETPFPTDIPAPALCMLKAVCTHAESTPAPILSLCSLDELMAVMSAANFLEADDAFRAGARQVHTPSDPLKPAQTTPRRIGRVSQRGALTHLVSFHPLAAQRALPRGQERRGAALGARCKAMSRTPPVLPASAAQVAGRPRLAGPCGSLGRPGVA